MLKAMPTWYSSLPEIMHWLIAAPFILYFLGLCALLIKPSPGRKFEGIVGWLWGPLTLGVIIAAFLGSIYGCILLLSKALPLWLSFVLGVPLGIALCIAVGCVLGYLGCKLSPFFARFKRKS
jgi:hypothetical protein